MDVRERLARLVLHNVSAATYAARRLRHGMTLELQLEPAPGGTLQLMAFHEGRLLGNVEPIPREYLQWMASCSGNRCVVDSIPVAQQDHMLKLLLVRLERGEPLEAPSAPAPALPEPVSTPLPEPELAAEPEPEPEPERIDPLPATIWKPELPAPAISPRVIFEPHLASPPQPSALRRHGLKLLLLAGFVGFTAAAAAGVHYLNTPCGRLWAYLDGIENCRVTPANHMHFETSRPNARALCASDIASLLPEVKLMRFTLTASASPVLITCRLSK